MGLGQFSVSLEAPSPLVSGDPPPKASADPLLSQALAPPTLRLVRGGLGSTLLPLPSPIPLTKRRVALTQPTAAPDVGRMLDTVQRNGRRDRRQDWAGVTHHCANHYARG